ncbi:MAG TPA: SLC13 family permease [Anaerolineales bacterium]|nr:SLC13 family permease [Anaerolineales bacterium]
MFAGLALDQLILLAIIVAAFALLMTEKIRIDLTAVLIILALAVTGILEPEEALAGFSSEPAIVVAAVFVLSGALYYTGLSDRLGRWIARLAGQGESKVMAVLMLSVAGLSAFTHHLTITAVMLPVTLKLCREQDIPPSRLLMPMSFAASLGTTITILGAPAFLISDRILKQAGRPGLGVFSIAPIGLALSLAGTVFMLLLGRFLLPERPGGDGGDDDFRLEGYYTELIVQPESLLIGQTIDEVESRYDQKVKIVTWFRRGQARRKPYFTKRVKGGDVLLVRTTPDELSAIQEEPGLALHPVVKYGEAEPTADEDEAGVSQQFVQAVIAPGSELEGRTVGQVDFHQTYSVLVVGIWRLRGWMRAELSRVKLRAGDVLVLLGSEEIFSRLSGNRSFLMFVPFGGVPYRRHKAPLAGGLLIATVLVAAFGILRIDIVLLAGAAAVVLAGCLTPRQAYQSIDIRIFVFIAGAIPLGQAMVKTGLSDQIAAWLQALVGGWHPLPVLLLFFLIAALVTQLMSDAGTTALLGPVAVALALALGHSPEAYVVTVAMAAVTSFLTPIGHHGNLLIYGPGRYRFSDFVRVGTPLTILVAIIVILIAPLLWLL